MITKMVVYAYEGEEDLSVFQDKAPEVTIESYHKDPKDNLDLLQDVMVELNDGALHPFIVGHVLERQATHVILKLFREPEGDDRDDEGWDFIVFLS